jgi:RimJ/RimL family protein N-acetyltransferase
VHGVEPIRTPRLVLAPLDPDRAAAIARGEFGGLRCGEGWPHEDTVDGVRLVLATPGAAMWLITREGVLIGDVGTHGPPDADGSVEIGYGVAEPYRGRGYGLEAISALCAWLRAQPDVRRVLANTDAENVPSRRILECIGFGLIGEDAGESSYALEGAARPSDG